MLNIVKTSIIIGTAITGISVLYNSINKNRKIAVNRKIDKYLNKSIAYGNKTDYIIDNLKSKNNQIIVCN